MVATESTRILVDAGVSCKRITEALRELGEDPSKLDALLITHEHSDHVKGVDVLVRKFGVPLYANPATLSFMPLYLAYPSPIASAPRQLPLMISMSLSVIVEMISSTVLLKNSLSQ